jgi:hypothetical protein
MRGDNVRFKSIKRWHKASWRSWCAKMRTGGPLPRCAPSIAVVGYPDLGGMLDDSTMIKRGKFGRHPPNEMPRAMTAREKISHGRKTLLDVLLHVLLDGGERANASGPDHMALGYQRFPVSPLVIFGIFMRVLS